MLQEFPLAATRHAAPGLVAHGEEVALGASSCGCLPCWLETGPRKLEEPPSVCQTAKSNIAGPSGGDAASEDGVSQAPKRARVVGQRAQFLGASLPDSSSTLIS